MSNVEQEYTMSEMYKLGMDCLVEKFGIVNTEKFLVAVKTGNLDYTEWRRNMFDGMSDEEFDAAVIEYGKAHPKKAGRE